MSAFQKAAVALTQMADRREPDIAKSRKATDVMERAFRLARGVTVAESVIAGVPVRRYSSGARSPGIVMHLHGGAYYCGSSKMGRCYSRVAADGGPDMVSVDYRLAPEYPYPAALEDTRNVFLALAADNPVAVMGDSAGGGLALALVQNLRDTDQPLPAALACFFPWADLTQSSASYTLTAGKDLMTKRGGDWAAGIYAGGLDPRALGISPVFGSFQDFPATLLVVGTADSLLDETRNVAHALREAGVEVLLRETRGGIHGFTTLPDPEARAAITSTADFLRDRLSCAATQRSMRKAGT